LIIAHEQQHALDELDLEAETIGELELDPGAAEGVRGGALQPYLTNFQGHKNGSFTGGCPPPAR
jgi:hypothetical protein